MASERVIAGLDVGTTSVIAVLAEPREDGGLDVLGVGEKPSTGIKRGNLVDLEATVEAISRALEQAQQMAGLEVREVFAAVTGDHIESMNSRGVIAVSGRDGEIGAEDVSRVVESARAVAIPSSREILHVLPQEFVVDDQTGIRDPSGMTGVRLEAQVHIVTASKTAVRNLIRSIERAGYRVAGLVAQPLASSWAVLEEDERRLGVVLLDVGAGTTGIAVWFEGSVHETAVIGIGGAQITNDIAIGLRTPLESAERVKVEYGSAFGAHLAADEHVELPGVGGRPSRRVSRHVLAAIVEPRVEEILVSARRVVERLQGTEVLAAGIVLTGGTSQLDGVLDLAEQVFEMPARRGVPGRLGGLGEVGSDPRFAASVGLVRFGADLRATGGAQSRRAATPAWRGWLRSRIRFLG